jgi:hypothetical protein
MRRMLVATSILFLLTSQALAWSEAGHKIIASIAFARLTPDEREKVLHVLVQHPRLKQDFLEQVPKEIWKEKEQRTEWLLRQAAVWSDIARGFKGDDLKKFHRSTQHYINLPTFLNDGDENALEGKIKVSVVLDPPIKRDDSMNIVQTIRLGLAMLADADATVQDKAVMLTRLFHLLGDIHQPLNSTALFSPKLFPEGDRGGNLDLTKQRGNLHAVLDQFLRGRATLKEAHQEAAKLLADQDLARVGERALLSLDEEVWLGESHKMAVDYA